MFEIRKIKKKNYFILVIILILTIIASLAVTRLNFSIQQKKLEYSPLAKEVKTYKLDNIEELIAKNNFIVFVSFVNDENVYKLEKDFIKLIKQNKIKEDIYYLDFSNNIDDPLMMIELKNQLKIDHTKLISLPAIIYYKDGTPIKVLSSYSNNQIFNVNEAYQLFDIYELIKND